jgi:hypothetical protein
MTLAETLQPRLADRHPAGTGPQHWSAPFADHGWTVTLTADKTDTLSCLIRELSLTRIGEPPSGSTARGWAERVAAQVSGLLEPLALIEADTTQNVAILRSVPPSRRGDTVAYYEVILTGVSQATLRRYQVDTLGAKREQVAFALTHEVLARVAGDIIG